MATSVKAFEFGGKKKGAVTSRIATPPPISVQTAWRRADKYHLLLKPRMRSFVGMMPTLMPSMSQRQRGAPSPVSSMKPISRRDSPDW